MRVCGDATGQVTSPPCFFQVKRAVGYFKEMRKPKTPCLDKYGTAAALAQRLQHAGVKPSLSLRADLSDVLPEDRQFLGEDIFFPFLPALGYDAGFVGPRTTLTPEQFCWMLQRCGEWVTALNPSRTAASVFALSVILSFCHSVSLALALCFCGARAQVSPCEP